MVPFEQMLAVARTVWHNKLRQRKRALILMLEPLFRCNLACAGCGKIQHPVEILRKNLSPEKCFEAADACRAPIISIPGGEPLLHPQIDEIVAGLVARRRFVYLCTNAIKLKQSLPNFQPSKYLTFSVHIDGPRKVHDQAVCREGVFDTAIDAIKAALDQGHRVTTNTTVFEGTAADELAVAFDELTHLGVEGITVSPGYSYERAPDQDHFLTRQSTHKLFSRLFQLGRRRGWKFNQTPLFLEFLQGNYALPCEAWASPAYNVFGWQKPCYLLDEGYVDSFEELLSETKWDRYGPAAGNPCCGNCMVHCGFEPSAVMHTLGTARGLLSTAALVLFGIRPAPPNLPDPRGQGFIAPSPAAPSLPVYEIAGLND